MLRRVNGLFGRFVVAVVVATAIVGVVPLVNMLDVEIAQTADGVVAVDQFGRPLPVRVINFGEKVVPGSDNVFVRTVGIWVETGRRGHHERPFIRVDAAGGCEQGASYGLLACLNQYYTRSGDAVAVDRYVAVWSRTDPQVALARAVVRAGVLGRCLPSSCTGSLSDSQEMVIDSPANKAVYELRPRWSGKFVEMSGLAYQCGNSSLTWGRGSATSSLEHSNVCQGSTNFSGGRR